MSPLTVPTNLAAAAVREGRQAWLETLPATVADLAQRWKLKVGEPFQPGGATAWVAPATTGSGEDVVMKLVWPHTEAAHETDGLRLWAGDGAVLLHEAADLGHTSTLLIERCRPGLALSARPEPEQDVVIAGLLHRLWVNPPPTTADQEVVLCTDLHAENVLAARRQPWLAIDPKPYVGDPTYDLLQHMLNCPARLHSDPIRLTVRMAELTGLDPHRTRQWLFARCVQESAAWPGLAEVARRIA
jgi:streptomycin 6-kinase